MKIKRYIALFIAVLIKLWPRKEPSEFDHLKEEILENVENINKQYDEKFKQLQIAQAAHDITIVRNLRKQLSVNRADRFKELARIWNAIPHTEK